jgi:phosphate transport system substrate-binding protein
MARQLKRISSLACFLLAGTLASSLGAETITIRLHGSNTLGSRLGPSLLEAFARQKGMVGVDRTETAELEFRIAGRHANGDEFVGVVKAHGTNTGRVDLMSGAADIWMASRAATAEEVAQAKAIGDLHSPQQEHVVALDGLAIIVHPDNPLGELRIEQIRDAFSGRISDWSQLGGKAGPIRLFGRDDQSGTYDSFKSMVLTDGAPLSGTARRFESSSELERSVAEDPAALGFVGFSYIAQAKPLAVRAEGTAPLKPEALSVSTEDYLLARRLYFYTAANATPEAAEFIEFVQSSSGQAVVAETGFVAQDIFVARVQPTPGNPPQYYDVTGNAERISMNFRFRPASSTLDSRALRDIERLSAFMRLPENQRKELRLAAFSPKAERAKMMTMLTLNDRVDHVSQLLTTRGVRVSMSRGFVDGPIVAPLGRGDSMVRNERVEVWLVDPAGGISGDRVL